MTELEALTLLGLASKPSAPHLLTKVFDQKLSAARARFMFPRSPQERNAHKQRMADLKEAYDLLHPLVGSAPPLTPVTVPAVTVAARPTVRMPGGASSQARSKQKRTTGAKARQARPRRKKPTSAATTAAPATTMPTGQPRVSQTTSAATTLSGMRFSAHHAPPRKAGHVTRAPLPQQPVPTPSIRPRPVKPVPPPAKVKAPAVSRAASAPASQNPQNPVAPAMPPSLKPHANGLAFVVTLLIVCAAVFLVWHKHNAKSRSQAYTYDYRTRAYVEEPARIKFLCWPVSRLVQDGSIRREVPSPSWFTIKPGSHTFEFVNDALGRNLHVRERLKEGKDYTLKVDLQANTWSIEESQQ